MRCFIKQQVGTKVQFIHSSLMFILSCTHVCHQWVMKIFLHIGITVHHVVHYLGEMEPAQECCILQSQTQVFVSPKQRTLSCLSHSPASDSNKCKFTSTHVDSSETRKDISGDSVQNLPEITLSPISQLVSGFKRFLFGSDSDLTTGNVGESATYKTEAWNIRTKLFCRVLALEDFTVRKLKNNITGGSQNISDTDKDCSNEQMSNESLSSPNLSVDSVHLLQQPTNVYVSIFTILSELPAVGLDSVPVTFLATLSRLKNPAQKMAADRLQRAKSAYSDSEALEEHDSHITERRIVVRVIVTYFNSESRSSGFQFVQPVPQKHILVSSLLRRQMNLSVTDKVALAPLCRPSDMHPAKINVYPLFSSVSCICLHITTRLFTFLSAVL